jgi:hypothetical protein
MLTFIQPGSISVQTSTDSTPRFVEDQFGEIPITRHFISKTGTTALMTLHLVNFRSDRFVIAKLEQFIGFIVTSQSNHAQSVTIAVNYQGRCAGVQNA